MSNIAVGVIVTFDKYTFDKYLLLINALSQNSSAWYNYVFVQLCMKVNDCYHLLLFISSPSIVSAVVIVIAQQE